MNNVHHFDESPLFSGMKCYIWKSELRFNFVLNLLGTIKKGQREKDKLV